MSWAALPKPGLFSTVFVPARVLLPSRMANYASLLKAPRVYNLPYIDDTDEKGKFRTALYWERGFELAFEGQRKYDLIRWNVLAGCPDPIWRKHRPQA